MTAYIGYRNILETGTVTVTSEQPDFFKENAYDWLPYDQWQAAAAGTVYLTVDMGVPTLVDYWSLAFHDLHKNSGTIKPQYSSDNFATDINDLDTVQTLTDGAAIMRKVTPRTVQHYRYEINSLSVASFIGLLTLGEILQLPAPIPLPFGSPVLQRDKKILNNVSQTNNFLGSSEIAYGYEFQIVQNLVSNAWTDTHWNALADHIETKPFLYSWDYENRPSEIMFAKAFDINYPKRNTPNRDDFSFECKGLIE